MSLRSPALLPVCFSVAAVAAAGEARFMTQPDIRGDRIVFAWEGDLYATSVGGGHGDPLDQPPRGRARPEDLARRQVDRVHHRQQQRPRRLGDARGGRRAHAAHLAAARRAGGGVDARQPSRRLPLALGRPSRGARPEALPGRPRRLDAGASAPRPGPERQLLPGRLEGALRPQGQRGLLLEALQGRAVRGHLDGRLRREGLQAGDGLRGPQRLPDVGGRHDVLQLGPLARRHHQPLGPGPEDGRRPPGDPLHRLRRHVALDRREAHRLRPGRAPARAGRRHRRLAQGPRAHPVRRLAPAGALDQPLGVRPLRGRGRATARPWSSAPGATSSTSPSRTRRRCPAT